MGCGWGVAGKRGARERCQEAWRALTWFKLVVPVQHLLPAVRSLLHQDVLSCHGIVVPQTHVRPASVAHTLPTLSQQQQQQGPVSHTSQHTAHFVTTTTTTRSCQPHITTHLADSIQGPVSHTSQHTLPTLYKQQQRSCHTVQHTLSTL